MSLIQVGGSEIQTQNNWLRKYYSLAAYKMFPEESNSKILRNNTPQTSKTLHKKWRKEFEDPTDYN